MKKRTGLSVIVASTALALILAGCASSPEKTSPTADANASPKSVSILYNYSNTAGQAAMAKIVTDYQKANPTTQVTAQGLSLDQYYTSLQTRVSAGNPPDVTLVPVGSVPGYAAMGVLANLTKYIPASTLSKFSSTRVDIDKQDGKIAGLPLTNSVRAVLYNKTAFDKAGIKVPAAGQKPWTWNQMVAAATKVQKKGGVQYGLMFEKPSFDSWLPFLYQAGGSLFNSKGKPDIANAAGIKALTWTKSLYTKGIAAPGVVEGTVDPVKLFESGQVGIWLSAGSYQVPLLDSQPLSFKYAATFLPTDVKNTTLIGGSDLVAFKGKNEAGAANFINFATSKKEMAGYDSAVAGIPPRSDVKSAGSKRTDVLAIFAQQQKFLDPSLNTQNFTVAYSSGKDALLRELQSVIIGEVTPAAGAKLMDNDLAKAANGG